MNRVVIDTARLHLEIEPDLGAGIADLSLRREDGSLTPLMRRAPARAAGFNDLACYTLVPWCNRIAGATFRFRGREHRLRPDWPDRTAIHGDAKTRPWRVLDRSPVAARFQIDSRDFTDPNWPWPYIATARYDLFDEALAVDLSVRNLGNSAMPAGLGLHPFWMSSLGHPHADCAVAFHATGRYPASGMIPTGPARRDDVSRRFTGPGTLDALDLDDVFACAPRPDPRDPAGRMAWGVLDWIADNVSLDIRTSPRFGHAVVYCPYDPGRARDWFCLEPVTMVNDGFNLMERGQEGTGVAVLEPGQKLEANVEFRLGARVSPGTRRD